MAYIKGEDRYQITLFPDSIDDYITENNPVRLIDAYINGLDVAKLGFKGSDPSAVGHPSYNPKDQIKLYLYGYLNRIRSSRRLEDEAGRNLEVIWLLNKLKPDFKTIADFRKDNKKALKEVFRDFNKLCNQWDLFGKETVAIDGTKIRACNSRKNNHSIKKLNKQLKHIEEKIDKYMKELDDTDDLESIDRKPDEEEIKEKIEELEKRKDKYANYKKDLEEKGENEISTTDPDARLMSNGNNSVDVSYNVQTTVDEKNKMVADFKVTQKPNDIGELSDMALRAKELFDKEELDALADKGYYNAEELKKCVENGITPYVAKQTYSNGTGDKDFYADKFKYDKEQNIYICPAGKELYYNRTRREKGKIIGYNYSNFNACKDCPYKDCCTKSKKGRTIFRHVDQDFLDTIDIQTEENIKKYRLRQMIVEHPFGTIKRSWGAYYFLTKGKESVAAETALIFLSYNFKRAMNILGIQEMLRRLEERREPALV